MAPPCCNKRQLSCLFYEDLTRLIHVWVTQLLFLMLNKLNVCSFFDFRSLLLVSEFLPFSDKGGTSIFIAYFVSNVLWKMFSGELYLVYNYISYVVKAHLKVHICWIITYQIYISVFSETVLVRFPVTIDDERVVHMNKDISCNWRLMLQ